MSEGQAALPQPGDLAEAPAAQQQQEQQQQPHEWISGRGNHGGPVAYCERSHVTFRQLEEDRRREVGDPSKLPIEVLCSDSRIWTYECKTDADHLEPERINHRFLITDLRHVTMPEYEVNIYADSGFRGFLNEENGQNLLYHKFVWWSVYFEQGSEPRGYARGIAERVQDRIRRVNPNFPPNSVEPSYPFQDRNFNIGTRAFCYPLEELINAYKQRFCLNQDSNLHIRILGTYVYHQEIMHAIVVHSSENENDFRALPRITNGFSESRVQMDGQGLMYWSPESVIMVNADPYSPWEHLSFAFHVPGDEVFELNDLERHCKDIGCVRPKKKKNGSAGKSKGPSTLLKDNKDNQYPKQSTAADLAEDAKQSATISEQSVEDAVLPDVSRLTLSDAKK